ncbi:MAG TPA: hypothetical protein EYP56_03195 [Planctomycetaceae bacterium]|nr:hypothetical protein [Planctomycetaceae bacterium]HIQ19797.1 hypothetical protein [Planctomycetota bacterium]
MNFVRSSSADRPIWSAQLAKYLLGALVLAALVLRFSSAAEQDADQVPLYLQEPYDQITLDERNDHAVLKVYPIKLPPGGIPEHPRPHEGIVIRLLDDPETPYEVKWHAIEEVKLFEELVLDEANAKVKTGKLDEAWDYFQFLLDEYPNVKGLEESIQRYLFQEAGTLAEQKQYAASLAVLRELYRRNPKYPDLERAAGTMTDRLVAGYVEGGQYASARRLVRSLAEMFPQHAVIQQWEGKWKEQAAKLLAEAQKAGQAGRWRQADQLLRRLCRIWPQLPGARQYMEVVHRRYPRVVVGVTQAAVALQPARLHDWAARRAVRLVHRTLTEFLGPGTDGGKYRSPLGEIEIQELGLRIAFRLDPDRRWFAGDSALTGYDLARRLLAVADPHDPAYRSLWAELLEEVSVEDVYTVYADLRRPHVRPEALLQTIVIPYTDPQLLDIPNLSNGPYVIDSREDESVVYVANPQYFAAGDGQAKEVVERRFATGLEALRALARHDVDVVDRINPWEKKKADTMQGVRVAPYAVPLVHVLIPNRQRPLTGRQTFRRALAFGIHRQAILEHLLGEPSRPGCQVISGPFAAGISPDDPLDYAYDHSIEPRRYDPRVALALANVALLAYRNAEQEKGVKVEKMPTLVLAHPAHEIARVACKSIQKHLGLLQIPIELRQLPPDAGPVIPEDVDLMYTELAMWEPAVDARSLLDFDGMSRGASPAMSLALRELEQATEWPEVAAKLREIHRIAFDDVAVIPLWQLTDHFAYHQGVQGIASRPVTLYQDIEQWRLEFYYPAEP